MRHKHKYAWVVGSVDARGNFLIKEYCKCGDYRIMKGWNDGKNS